MEGVNHEQRAHALLSASGASKWLNCTVAPRLEEGFQDKESDFAKEGTLAHEFAELGVRLALKQITQKEYDKAIKPLVESPYYSSEMGDEVQKHIDYVMEVYSEALSRSKDALIQIEEKIDLTHYIEDGFGTNDDVIIADGVLDVIDLKYGKGVRVSAIDNSQLKLYGLGALRANELAFDITTIRLHIVQPRLDHISVWEISAEDLRTWGEEVVKPKAIQAYAGEGEQIAGDHCRWCKAKARCKAFAEKNLELAKHEFADPHLLSDQELIDAFKRMPSIQDWVATVSEYLLAEALKGKKWPEYKLVEGRSNRVWKNDIEVATKLESEGYQESQICNIKLKGIGDIEKLLGKKDFPVILDGLVIKPQGKPSLVPDTDKRPALGIDKAQTDFEDIT